MSDDGPVGALQSEASGSYNLRPLDCDCVAWFLDAFGELPAVPARVGQCVTLARPQP